MAASSKKWFPPYFYFRLGQKRPSDGVFHRFLPFLPIIVQGIAPVDCQSLTGRHPTSDNVTSGVAQTGSSF